MSKVLDNELGTPSMASVPISPVGKIIRTGACSGSRRCLDVAILMITGALERVSLSCNAIA